MQDLSPDGATYSFWFQRFQALAPVAKDTPFWQCRDWLFPPVRKIAAERLAHFSGLTLQRALFQFGFTPAAISSFGCNIASQPRDDKDVLFWQFPCRTEEAAWQLHAPLAEPRLEGDNLHIYIGLPWATWIDCRRKQAFGMFGEIQMRQQLQTLKLRLNGLRCALAELGLRLRVHSVCQHINWRDLLPEWIKLGISDIWLSHCPQEPMALALSRELQAARLQLHPWSLFAVNVQEPTRTDGITIGKDPKQKAVLASFVGAHAEGYLSDVRLRLRGFENEPGFVIRVNDKWHFEDVVYRHQIGRGSLADNYKIDASVTSYNRLLSDSQFSLCPSGTGPNSLRLWESLAIGAVPVLLGPAAQLPAGGNLPIIDWEKIVVRVTDAQFARLPTLLRSIPLVEIRQRQQLSMQAFAKVSQQRCF